MDTIPLSTFVDYTLSMGVGRLSAVRAAARNTSSPAKSDGFYVPLRDMIADAHRAGPLTRADNRVMAAVMALPDDERAMRVFPKIVSSYYRFVERYKSVCWFEPPMRDFPIGPAVVRVDPDFGLLIDGRPYIVKVYWRGDPAAPQHFAITTTIMAQAMQVTWPGTVLAALDVRRGKLYEYKPHEDIWTLVRAEAASYAEIARSL